MTLADRDKKQVPRMGCKKQPSLLVSKTSLASVESLAMPLVQEVVLSADFRCADCQKRVADVISRMNEMESVVVNVLEKKVSLTCRYPSVAKVPTWKFATSCRNPPGKFTMFMRIFRSSCR
ncbi:hypothetical protein L1049_006142 [Liquidambar formosana]|uniref:HMA domain-containing protein n=1 Tax=Liquidambar formosana TaxID=63359 RepID=A0AAP0WQN0_LIQFO